ncbi:MAG: hypothetical protein VX899_00740 [Myxococcota bacterium]|nr:hypothetical protein [Myxococcota bacterium]
MRDTSYRIHAELDLAVRPGDDSVETVMAPLMARQLAGEAREAVELLSPRRDKRVKEALSRVLDAVEVLEREMEWIWRRQLNAEHGMVLERRPVVLTPFGLELSGSWPEGPATLQLGVVLGQSWRLLGLPVQVKPLPAHGQQMLGFGRLSDPDRDLLAALALDLQRKERRRERSAVP